MLTINGIEDLKGRVGEELGVSEWQTIGQDVINAFADATGDHQFIHVDVEKAKQTPFGGTIAHGLLTSRSAPSSPTRCTPSRTSPSASTTATTGALPGSGPGRLELRMRATLSSVDDVPGGVQLKITQTFEVEGGEKPVCVAEQLVRLYGAPQG